MTTNCTSSTIASNCIRFEGSEIGTNITKSIIVNGNNVQVTLNNWVLHQNNKYKCFNFSVIGDATLSCSNANTTNGNASLSGTSGSYCAPITVSGSGKKRVTTQHTVNSVTFCFSVCQGVFGNLEVSATEICSQNTTVYYTVTLFPNQIYQWFFNNQLVNAVSNGFVVEYTTPNNLPVGQHILKLIISNNCESKEFISNLTVKQSPVATINSNLNIQSGAVPLGSQLNFSWSINFSPSATFEHFTNNILIASQINVTSGSYIVNLVPGSHKIVITSTNPISGCVLINQIPFNVFDPLSVPVITLNFNPALIDGNKMLALNDYFMTWSATNVSPYDLLTVEKAGDQVQLFQGQPLIFNLLSGTHPYNFSITNPYNITGTKSLTITII